MTSKKTSIAAPNTRDEDDIRRDDLPALLVIPEGLEIPPWDGDETCQDNEKNLDGGRSNNDGLGCDDGSSLSSLKRTPLSCIQLPTGASLFSANLAFLRKAGVREIYVLARRDVMPAVENHLKEKCCRKALKSSLTTIRVTPIWLPLNCHSVGDALRTASTSTQLIGLRTDFIVMISDTICRIDLKTMISTHKVIKKQQPTTIMTRLISKFPQSDNKVIKSLMHPSFDNNTIILINESTLEILRYFNCSTSHIPITSNYLGKVPGESSLRFITNTVESGMEICTPQLLQVLEKSFDYSHLRPDLINGLTTAELKLETISAFVPREVDRKSVLPPSLRMATPELLFITLSTMVTLNETQSDIFSSDVRELVALPRTTTEFVHQSVHLPPSTLSSGGFVFIGEGSNFRTSENLESNVIRNSFVGKNVQINSNTTIETSIIFDGVTLGSGVICRNSLIYPNCNIGENVVLEMSTVGQSATIRNNENIKEAIIIGAEDSNGTVILKSLADFKLKTGIRSNLFHPNLEEANCKTLTLKEFFNASKTEEDSDWSDDHDSTPQNASNKKVEDDSFFTEIYSMALEGYRTSQYMVHKLLEIKSYRLACNERLSSCIRPCVKAFIDEISFLASNSQSTYHKYLQQLQFEKVLAMIAPLDNSDAQYQLLDAFLEYSSRPFVDLQLHPHYHDDSDGSHNGETSIPQQKSYSYRNILHSSSEFSRILQLLVEENLVDDDLLCEWYHTIQQKLEKGEKLQYMDYIKHPHLQQYVQYLKNLVEEESSSNEED